MTGIIYIKCYIESDQKLLPLVENINVVYF